MDLVLLTALGVGGATIIGALTGFAFKKITHTFSDIMLSFAAGVMLAAAVMGLVLPSIEHGLAMFGEADATTLTHKLLALLMTVAGVFAGAVCVNLIDKLVPHLHRLTGVDQEMHPGKNDQLNKVLLFVMAIAIHNLPEGIAAGVGFGTGNTSEALIIAGGIALQNIPEGMVIIGQRYEAGSHIHHCYGDRCGGGFGYTAGLFGRERVYRHSAFCPGFCRRHHAVCHQ